MPNENGATISIKTLSAALVILSIGGVFWGVASNIVTKSDFRELSTRVRDLERQVDRFFGKTQASFEVEVKGVAFAAEPEDVRTAVVTKGFIAEHNLRPSKPGSSYLVRGEDGQLYSLDEVLAVLIQEHDKGHTKRK